MEQEEEDDDSEYSSYPNSPPTSSRTTSGSYAPNRPILSRRKSLALPRPARRRLPTRIVRYLCLGLISTLIIFMLSLVRMSVVSSKRVGNGQSGSKSQPAVYESFEFLSRYYGGIRTLVPASENKPEYPQSKDEQLLPSNDTIDGGITYPIGQVPASKPFEAYANHTSKSYSDEYTPVQECFLDAKSQIHVPQLQYYEGKPSGFPDSIMGSYDLLGLPGDICFERYGKLGPYGYGYGFRNGGTGTGQHGEMEGSEAVWVDKSNPEKTVVTQVDYRNLDWADAQRRCYKANEARFEKKALLKDPPTTFSVLDSNEEKELKKRNGDESIASTTGHASTDTPKMTLQRSAFVIRVWDEFRWREEDIIYLRSVISELSLGSGGEFDVHLLVQVRNEGLFPVFADAEAYQRHVKECVPEEFSGIVTLWSETQMLLTYQGLFDTFTRDLPVHGSYRGLQMAMQLFAQKHQEYDFFWAWEMDIRYTGHIYDLLTKLVSWTKAQPRKGLWERSSRYYIPSVHGTWEDFKHMVRVQTEIGTDSPTKLMLSGTKMKDGKGLDETPKGDKPIWGPERPQNEDDWFEHEDDPVPPTTYEKDKYTWGVGEEADLITLNPLFDPASTTWLLAEDVTGYNLTGGLPPRRATIVAASRMSRKLLNTMHRETAFKKHHAFTEMWAPTTALHHGYKAVYAPHPIFVDREWPTEYLASVMNAGRNGATGGARTSVFGDREHHLRGLTWFYNSGFSPNLYKRWLGFKVNNEGGEEFEMTVNEGRSGKGVNDMKGGEGRMCLPPMLLHPVKEVDLAVEDINMNDLFPVPESDPNA